jgi:hypothetical protein
MRLSLKKAIKTLIDATVNMHRSGIPLMRRVLPMEEDIIQWDHYPENDVVDRKTKSRFFYHCHPPEERGAGEHGHFHLFLSKESVANTASLAAPEDLSINRADVVHIIALSVDKNGIPIDLFSVNRWVTDEWLYPHADIVSALDYFNLEKADGDPLVNAWMTALVFLARPLIANLLAERDAILLAEHASFENRTLEIISRAPLDIQALIAGND